MNYTINVRLCCLLTANVIGVDVLDRSSADVCGLSPQGDSPQLIHTTQLQRERERGRGVRENISKTNQTGFKICCIEPRNWSCCHMRWWPDEPDYTDAETNWVLSCWSSPASAEASERGRDDENQVMKDLFSWHILYKSWCLIIKVKRPSPGRDVCTSPCPWHAGLYCGLGSGTSARRRRNTQSPPLNSATGCPPAPDSTLTHTGYSYCYRAILICSDVWEIKWDTHWSGQVIQALRTHRWGTADAPAPPRCDCTWDTWDWCSKS